MTHCPVFPSHRRVVVRGRIVHMVNGTVDIVDAVNVLWADSAHLASILVGVDRGGTTAQSWTRDWREHVVRQMTDARHLPGHVRTLCRRAKLRDEVARVTASAAMYELQAAAILNVADSELDRIKALFDEAHRLLEKATLDAFLREYPAYTYPANALVNSKRRRTN